MKVRASSLFFALIISLLVALVSSGFILATSYHWISVDGYLEEHRMINNCKSGMSILLSNNNLVDLNQEKTFDLYDTGEDSVTLNRRSWGIYEIAHAKAFGQGQEVSESALVGSVISQKDRFALYLTDRNSPLSLCGRTLIKGKTYLPEAGVKRAYIEGQNFVGARMINGVVVRSEDRVPRLHQDILNSLSFRENSDPSIFEHVQYADVEVDSIGRSFFEKTLVVNLSDSVSLTGMNFNGNVIIKSNHPVFIKNSCQMNKAMVFAPRIYIDNFSNLSGQFFASEKLIVGSDCDFKFPSVLSVTSKSSAASCELIIGENSSLVGTVIVSGPSGGIGHGVKLEENSLVVGQVYTSNSIDLKGDIHGSLVCEKIKLKTPSSVYENHLLNVEINATKLPADFPGIACFGSRTLDKRIISYPE